MSKNTRKPATARPATPITPMALVGAIYENNGTIGTRAVLSGADDALAWAVAHQDGLIEVLTGAAERLNQHALGVTYQREHRVVDIAMKGQRPTQFSDLEALNYVRNCDVEAAFAIGLAAGLRLAGGGR